MNSKLIDQPLFYQFGFFVQHNVKPEPKVIEELVKFFSSQELIPSTIDAYQIDNQGNFYNSLQLQLISIEKEWSVNFERNRFLIEKKAIDSQGAGEIDEFFSYSKEITSKLYEMFQYSAHRLSFVTKGLCKNMDEETLNASHDKIFTLPSLFTEKSNKTKEWSTRQVARLSENIKEKKELLNVIFYQFYFFLYTSFYTGLLEK